MSKRRKRQGKKPARLPLTNSELVRLGVTMTSARHTYRELLEEAQDKAPGMKRLLRSLRAVIARMGDAETVLTDYGLKFYPDQRWPRTVAFRRDDLKRST